MDEQREATNKQMKEQKKQQTISSVGMGAASGAMIGAQAGSAIGPGWGTVIGAGVGYLTSLF